MILDTSYITLNKADCVNCYKCIRNCPVKSIRFSAGQANIVKEDCILCGNCYVVCPQNAKEIKSDLEKAKVMLMDPSKKVIASIAPSFIANYDGIGIVELGKQLKKLGFYAAYETARGAKLVVDEYQKILNEEKRSVIITSSCHSVNLLIEKYYPEAIPYLADCLSPMQAHAKEIKETHDDALVIFIGPCISKKNEVDRYIGSVDLCLTFDELSTWLSENNLLLDDEVDELDESLQRFFPTTGGILKSMTQFNEDFSYLALDGVETCMAALEDVVSGKIKNCFIEMSSCKGSCLGGPIMEKYANSPVKDYIRVANYAGKKDFVVKNFASDLMKKDFEYLKSSTVYPSEREIKEIYLKMGKKDETYLYNCGSCGYHTCRDKAIAVYQQKAEITMCLPFLKDKAESFSDNIINNTPNGIIVLNDNLEIQKINKAALNMFNLTSPNDCLGDPLVRLIDPVLFVNVLTSGKNVTDKLIYLSEYNLYVEMSISYDVEYKVLIAFIKDVTNVEIEKNNKEKQSQNTVEIADKVIEKQMRIVQEIASLLGETAAETKVALTKLKESIKDE